MPKQKSFLCKFLKNVSVHDQSVQNGERYSFLLVTINLDISIKVNFSFSEEIRRLRNILNLFSNGSINMREKEQEIVCKYCKQLVGSNNSYMYSLYWSFNFFVE